MKLYFRQMALAAVATASLAMPLGSAQAQNAYDFLLWPFVTPVPSAPLAPAPLAAPAPVPQRQAAMRPAPVSDLRYERTADAARPTSSGALIIGVGF